MSTLPPLLSLFGILSHFCFCSCSPYSLFKEQKLGRPCSCIPTWVSTRSSMPGCTVAASVMSCSCSSSCTTAGLKHLYLQAWWDERGLWLLKMSWQQTLDRRCSWIFTVLWQLTGRWGWTAAAFTQFGDKIIFNFTKKNIWSLSSYFEAFPLVF